DCLRPWRGHGGAGGDRMLTGPDPYNRGAAITQTLDWWFQQKTPAFMRALACADSGLIESGDAERSALVDVLTAHSPGMVPLLGAELPHHGGRTGMQVVRRWIEAGCPLPPDVPRLRLSLSSHAALNGGLPLEYLHGMGTIH
ncbi:MAG: hypothetical protein ACYDCQ_09570, partial [Dehalococcoidia bacterium]